ncbi:MAG TPA: OPT/YSL family transporter, partial [Vicinamibacterales bacterium]|nr:OPT/YSL family transporter [Vicinamibacterales bacterium]
MPTRTEIAEASVAEFTLKAVAAGVVLGIVFGAANAYLGLRVGLTVSASIPAAVMTVALFRLFRARGTILEANLSQTIGSASTSLASGTIFTIPALFMWNMAPPYLQVVVLAFLGALLGLAAMIPLRRLLVVQSHDELPYPEGTACAEVLRATTGGASASAWISRPWRRFSLVGACGACRGAQHLGARGAFGIRQLVVTLHHQQAPQRNHRREPEERAEEREH